MDADIIRLEEKIAYQDQTIAHLDEVVQDLNRKVVALTQEMADIRAQATPIDSMSKQGEEKPPHYGGIGSETAK